LLLEDSEGVQPGEDIVVVGAPLGFRQTVTTGAVSGPITLGNVEWLQFSAPISAGSSGSPVVNTRARVIGMVTAGHVEAPQINIAVPSNVISTLLASGDSVRPLVDLPGGEDPAVEREEPEESAAAPTGLTGFYWFETLSGYTFEYVWLVENPSGRLTGAVFAPHPTGFFDVFPLQKGSHPGRRRDFDFVVGCAEFEGWIREDGALAGDVSDACERDDETLAFRAESGVTVRSRTAPLEGVQQFLVRSEPADTSFAWAWFVVVGPRKLREGTVGAMHVWGALPGGPGRRDLFFSRGGVFATDSVYAELLTVDLSIRVAVRERDGAVHVRIYEPGAADPLMSLEGYRSDLRHCFDAGDTVRLASARTEGVRRSLQEAINSIARSEAPLQRPEYRTVHDSLLALLGPMVARRDSIAGALAELDVLRKQYPAERPVPMMGR
jgi:hypothetical protein